MRNLAVLACLIVGVSLLGGAVPVAKVEPFGPGYFWIWIQNTDPCFHGRINVVLTTTEVAKVETLIINGQNAKASASVASGVITVNLDPKLPPKGWLIVAVKVPTTLTADKLLKYKEAFTYPPRCP